MYLVPGGVPDPRGVSGWGVYLVPRSVPDPGGCLVQGRVCSRGGCGIPACTEAGTPSVNRMTNSSKKITLATISLWPVKKKKLNRFFFMRLLIYLFLFKEHKSKELF